MTATTIAIFGIGAAASTWFTLGMVRASRDMNTRIADALAAPMDDE